MPLVVVIDHATVINRYNCRSTPAHSDHLKSATELIDVPTRQCEIHHINQLRMPTDDVTYCNVLGRVDSRCRINVGLVVVSIINIKLMI